MRYGNVPNDSFLEQREFNLENEENGRFGKDLLRQIENKSKFNSVNGVYGVHNCMVARKKRLIYPSN